MRQPAAGHKYTVAEYMSWNDEGRWELIDGEAFAMAPAPVLGHQSLLNRIFLSLNDFLRGASDEEAERCEIFLAPVDVVLGIDTVVQPDASVVCDAAKLANGRYVDGAPDIVVEILSPSTTLRDRRDKRNLYERCRVPTYLIVDPQGDYAELYELDAAAHYAAAQLFGPDEPISLRAWPGALPTLGWFAP